MSDASAVLDSPETAPGSEPRREPLQLRVGSFRLHADRWRGGARGHALLLHGLGGNSITWHAVAPRLAREFGVSVLALDLPGFGASRPGAAGLDLRVLSSVIEQVLRAEAPAGTRWLLAGNSLGGLLALELACRCPERVAAVNLAALALPLDWGRRGAALGDILRYVPVALPWQGRRLVEQYVRSRGVPGVVDDPIRLLFRDPTRLDAGLRQQLIEVSEYRLTWADEAARAYEQVTRSLGLRLICPRLGARWIQRVRCPVQSIYGTVDPLYPRAAWQRLEQARPDWEHVPLHDIGHVPQLEAPHEFSAELSRWLNGAALRGQWLRNQPAL
ncbi:MAG TPA: alpha/beta hydrolase [Polyangiaceae bacterium]|nr:alpha/beta hydrolase [Polyangiaceae bacterium]